MSGDKIRLDDCTIIKLHLSKKVINFFKSRAIMKNVDYREEISKYLENQVDVLRKYEKM